MNLDDFKIYNRMNHKCLPTDPNFKAELPSPDTIYYKDFHFLDEPLIYRRYPPSSAIPTAGPLTTPSLVKAASCAGATTSKLNEDASSVEPPSDSGVAAETI